MKAGRPRWMQHLTARGYAVLSLLVGLVLIAFCVGRWGLQ